MVTIKEKLLSYRKTFDFITERLETLAKVKKEGTLNESVYDIEKEINILLSYLKELEEVYDFDMCHFMQYTGWLYPKLSKLTVEDIEDWSKELDEKGAPYEP